MTSRHNLRLVWTNPNTRLEWLDFWINSMNDYLKYMDRFRGLWTAPHLIPSGKWIKKVCLEDGFRIVYIVLDYNGVELASVPVNFSVADLPHLAPKSLDRIVHI